MVICQGPVVCTRAHACYCARSSHGTEEQALCPLCSAVPEHVEGGERVCELRCAARPGVLWGEERERGRPVALRLWKMDGIYLSLIDFGFVIDLCDYENDNVYINAGRVLTTS